MKLIVPSEAIGSVGLIGLVVCTDVIGANWINWSWLKLIESLENELMYWLIQLKLIEVTWIGWR